MEILKVGDAYKASYFLSWNIMPVGPTLWNSLPLELRSATSVSSYKSKLKPYLLSQAFSYVYWIIIIIIISCF